MFTFLHAADIHLDSPLKGLDRYEGAPVEEIRGATRRALENLVDLAISEKVDFVVLAGDLYDGDWRDFDTGLFFVRQMTRLREAEIPVYGVHGNHDAASKITRSLRLPENVIFYPTDAPETRRLEDLGVAIHGQSFARQCTSADLAKDYPAAVGGCFNLGVLHTSMEGREGHGSYAPCSESCLRERGYDYWALGHIHQREVLNGRPIIAYPGNLQGRHIRETGPKGCLIVYVDDAFAVEIKFQPLDVLRWDASRVALDNIDDRGTALEAVEKALRSALDDADGRLLAVRIVLTGETPLARDIAADPRQWAADIRSTAIDIDANRLWVEKVKNETTEVSEEGSSGDDTPVGEVAAIVKELLSAGPEELGVDLGELARKLPAELKEALNPDDGDWWRKTLLEAQAKLLAEIRG